MKVFLLYEFTYFSYDEDIQENVLFIGLFKNKEDAIKEGNKRIKQGIKNVNVIVSEDIKNQKNPFEETDCVEMCRDDDELRVVYTINIEELEIEGEKK